MTSLREMQDLFYRAVFAPGDDNYSINEVSKYISATPGLSPQDHFSIYRRSITASLNRALREIYPVCCRLVGERFFDAMGKEYQRQFASRSADLAEYGSEFAAFISEFRPATELVYLADVARLELACHRAFHAADEGSIDLAALDNISEDDKPRIVFHLPVSASLLASKYPVHHIWQVNQPDFKGDDRVNLDEGGVKLIIWRQGYAMRLDPLESCHWDLLREIQAGNDLQTICEIFSRQENGIDVVQELPVLVQRGWIGSFQLVAG